MGISHQIKKTALVTGATGFIGEALVKSLLNDGYQVNCGVRAMPDNNNKISNAHYYSLGDFSQLPDWEAALDDMDSVIHLAGRVHVMRETESDPVKCFREANVDATLHLARCAAKAKVRRFIYASTVKVHGEETLEKPFSESDRLCPVDPYAISKYEAEEALMKLGEETGMEVVIFRPVLVYGPGVKGNFYKLIELVDRGIPLPFSAMQNQRSLIGLDNLVDVIKQFMTHPAAANQRFLVSDDDLSTEKLVQFIGKALGRTPRLFRVPVLVLKIIKLVPKLNALANRLFGSLQINNTKLRRTLGWEAQRTSSDGINETITWYLEQRARH
ncbi:MAG: NAD-dependent epimerase/dehydratase family protein [Gammaproteobacteria bacterium]|nr:NAD-dependent epimerase/dehydratase family protein [Gammaproteobacteria bacterium]